MQLPENLTAGSIPSSHGLNLSKLEIAYLAARGIDTQAAFFAKLDEVDIPASPFGWPEFFEANRSRLTLNGRPA